MKMNRLLLVTGLLIVWVSLSSCNDILDAPPKDRVAASNFFKSVNDMEVYTNGLYDMLPAASYYRRDVSSDNIVPLNPAQRVKGTREVPTGRGSGGWSWSDLREINFFLDNYQRVQDEDAKQKYAGIARFFRAYFYYDKVKMFGNVPWYNEVLEAGDGALYKPRDPREMVMDSVLSDINYAIANIPPETKVNTITKYTALILKARLSLFEGTFRKYHQLGNHEKFLEEAVSASEELINSGAYRLFTSEGPDYSYRELFARNNQGNTETILAYNYEPDLGRHSLGYRMTSPTAGSWGMPKDLINSYLMEDGSRFTSQPNYQTMEYYEEMQNRDPRLTQTTAGPNFIPYGDESPTPVNLSGTTTGYRVIKALPTTDQWSSYSSYNDIILFRYAEALLIYAEAKAELGTITQSDLDISINKLRDRVAMPDLNLAAANANPDPFLENMYPNVDQGPNKGVILEIRRERRIEMFNEGVRWDDLMRWKEGKKLEQPMVGIYFSGLGSYDFNGDGSTDVYLHDGNASGAPSEVTTIINVQQRSLTNGTSGYLNPFPGSGSFDESKDYYYPIPTEDLNLNDNMDQNPEW